MHDTYTKVLQEDDRQDHHTDRRHPTSSWRHPMKTFSAVPAICAGNSPVTGEFPVQSQWRGDLMFSLICAWINGWVNNREAGDLRHHRTHYDVPVMYSDNPAKFL